MKIVLIIIGFLSTCVFGDSSFKSVPPPPQLSALKAVELIDKSLGKELPSSPGLLNREKYTYYVDGIVLIQLENDPIWLVSVSEYPGGVHFFKVTQSGNIHELSSIELKRIINAMKRSRRYAYLFTDYGDEN